MKRIMYSIILVMSLSLLTAGLVAITANTTSATSDPLGMEVAVCQFDASFYGSDFHVGVTVWGTGSINPSGNGLGVGNYIGDAGEGSDEIACAAFHKLAESRGCTASDCRKWGVGHTGLNCVCQGTHNQLIPVIGALMRFPFTWTPAK